MRCRNWVGAIDRQSNVSHEGTTGYPLPPEPRPERLSRGVGPSQPADVSSVVFRRAPYGVRDWKTEAERIPLLDANDRWPGIRTRSADCWRRLVDFSVRSRWLAPARRTVRDPVTRHGQALVWLAGSPVTPSTRPQAKQVGVEHDHEGSARHQRSRLPGAAARLARNMRIPIMAVDP